MAAPLTPDQALARLKADRAKVPAATNNQLNLVKQGSFEGMTSYYVFSNDNKAFILSANDLAVPVLGYIDRPVSADTEMPPQLKWWLEQYGAKIKAAQENYGSLPQATQTAPRKSENKAYVAPMITTYWNQDAPYNVLCPEGTYTGCVATAMAQVMKYHNYPDCGTGTVSTEYNGKVLSMTLDSAPLDWANMLPYYIDGEYNSTQANAVATLMKECGYSVKMMYGTDMSGAYSEDLPQALVDNFKYDAGINIYHADYYSPEEWADMIYTEVSEGRPVLYDGAGEAGGHEFVCDGYQDGYFHFNWGWGGYYDGFFALNNLVPDGQGIGGNGEGFNEQQSIVTGICKPVPGSKHAEAYFVLWGEMTALSEYADQRAIALSGGDNGGFYNMSGWDGIFDIAFRLTDNSTNEEYYQILYENSEILKRYGTEIIGDYISADIPDGTYTVELVYRLSGNTEWKNILIPYATPTTVTATLTSNYADVKVTIDKQENPDPGPSGDSFTYSNPTTESGFYTNSTADLTLNIANPNNQTVSRNLTPMLLNQTDDSLYIISTGDPIYVSLSAGESKDYSFYCPIGDIDPGQYIWGLVNDKNQLEIGYYIDVMQGFEPLQAKTFNASTGFIVGGYCDLTVEIENPNSEQVTATIDCCLCTDDGQYYIPEFYFGEQQVVFGPKSTEEIDFSTTLPATLRPGVYTLLILQNSEILGVTDVTVEANTSGASAVTSDEENDVEYYDLQGRRVQGTPATPGIYVRRAGSASSKVIIK